MAAKQFIITSVKKSGTWSNAYGEFQDYALAIRGVGAPVKLSVAEPVIDDPKPGDLVYGRLVQEKAADGRRYYTIKTEARDERQVDIHAQVALKIAVEVWLRQGAVPEAYDNIKTEAVHFGRLINEIKEEL